MSPTSPFFVLLALTVGAGVAICSASLERNARAAYEFVAVNAGPSPAACAADDVTRSNR